MAYNLLASSLRRSPALAPLCSRLASSSSSTPVPTEHAIYADKIGTREIVGFGWNSLPAYDDRVDFPFPAIRWREETAEIKKLREKEKGDWKKLSKKEKKALYRASFRQTYAEFKAPNGDWKLCIAGALIALSLALWIAIWLRLYVLPPYPSSLSEESRKAQLRRMLILEVDPIDGLSSKWDYENKKWK